MGQGVRLLWLDAGAGAVAGLLGLLLAGWLSDLYRLPLALMLFIAAANVLYACYSFSLVWRRQRSVFAVHLLIAANLAWAGVCVGLAWHFAGEASVFGLLHLTAEALFVGGLAAVEWQRRGRLVSLIPGTRPAATAQTP
ncbi:hypothetical protein [Roseateles asaccharophilus]|uniref:Uncharacterized protein n=1 Tax=Roseateles asaccharophilus TaxID=582607 RepID=A0ABU2A9T7_9BURK|nr:hypothetical protein [Roseateles asaccharophilus]MDR7333962.1 hypothetical protein [Roseateles asaccharophilus]